MRSLSKAERRLLLSLLTDAETLDLPTRALAVLTGLSRRLVAEYRAEFDASMVYAAKQLGADKPALKIYAG